MMETIKRHAFLMGLVAGVVVISLAVVGTVYFVYVGPNADTRQTLRSTKTRAQSLMKGPLFSASLVEQMGKQVERRQTQHEELLAYIRQLGAARKPLVADLFPVSTDIGLRHSFKGKYDEALEAFMKRLGAITPVMPVTKDAKGQETEKTAVIEENRAAPMFAHAKASFFRPEWVDRQDAPPMEAVRIGQEDLWLMEDLVEIVAVMNDEFRKAGNLKPIIAASPVKELIEIRVGGEAATIPGAKMISLSTRYRPAYAPGARAAGGPEVPAATVSGRNSKPDFYLVLPWRLSVVVETRYIGELVRRLKGSESFLSVEAWRMTPVTEASFERSRDLLALSREDYGPQGVARLDVTGDSLVFQLPGGRVTTVVKAPEPPKKEEPKAAPKTAPKVDPKKKTTKAQKS